MNLDLIPFAKELKSIAIDAERAKKTRKEQLKKEVEEKEYKQYLRLKKKFES